MQDNYPAFSYDDIEIDEIVASADIEKLKICDACGRQFLPQGRNAWRMRFCQRQHYIKCPICGNTKDISLSKRIVNTCSKKCGDIFKVQQMQSTMLTRYGVSNPSQVTEFKEKARASNALHKDETMVKIHNTMIERYGAAIPRQVPELREKIDNTMMERYGVVNPSHSKIIREKISKINSSEEVKAKYKATSLAHFGTEYPAQSPDSPNSWGKVKDKFESTMVARYGERIPFRLPEFREKARQTCLVNYGYEYPSQSPEIRRKQWNTRKNIRGCDGTPLDSTWERTVYNFWKSLNLEIERNIPIIYNYRDKQHTTFIDFRVNGILYEVKGNHYLDGVCAEDKNIPIDVKLDVYRKYDVVIIANTTSNLIFNDGTLTGVDLILFSDIPDFPYDDKTRWTILEYLVKHKKGFIGLDDF